MHIRTIRILGIVAMCIAAIPLPSVVLAQAASTCPPAPKKSEVIAAGGVLVHGDQVKKMFLGNTVYFIWLAAFRGYLRCTIGPVYSPDDRHSLSIGADRNRTIETLWWMEGEARCNEFPDGGTPTCRVVYELKDKTMLCPREGDLCPVMLRVVPGNAENIRLK